MPWQRKAKTAVKKGVVAPIAWLNETGRYLRLAFPRTWRWVRGGGEHAHARQLLHAICMHAWCLPLLLPLQKQLLTMVAQKIEARAEILSSCIRFLTGLSGK